MSSGRIYTPARKETWHQRAIAASCSSDCQTHQLRHLHPRALFTANASSTVVCSLASYPSILLPWHSSTRCNHTRHDIADPRASLSASLCLDHPPAASLRRQHVVPRPLTPPIYGELRVPFTESTTYPVTLSPQWRVGSAIKLNRRTLPAPAWLDSKLYTLGWRGA